MADSNVSQIVTASAKGLSNVIDASTMAALAARGGKPLSAGELQRSRDDETIQNSVTSLSTKFNRDTDDNNTLTKALPYLLLGLVVVAFIPKSKQNDAR